MEIDYVKIHKKHAHAHFAMIPWYSIDRLYFTLCCPFYEHGLTLIPAWINNYTHYNAWDEINYPFLNFNGATVEV